MLKELLDDAVLQRMEGDDHEPPAWGQSSFGGFERRRQFLQFMIYGDAQCLENTGRWRQTMLMRMANHPFQQICQFLGTLPWTLLTTGDDRPGDLAGKALFAEFPENIRKFLGGKLIEQISGSCSRGRVHPHVQRSIKAEGETTFRSINLRRRDSDVQKDAVNHRPTMFIQRPFHLGESPMPGVETFTVWFQTFAGCPQSTWVTVNPQHLRFRERLQKRGGIAAATQRAVQKPSAIPPSQCRQRLALQNWLVDKILTHFSKTQFIGKTPGGKPGIIPGGKPRFAATSSSFSWRACW